MAFPCLNTVPGNGNCWCRERASPAHPGHSPGLLLLCGLAGQPGTIPKPRGPKWAWQPCLREKARNVPRAEQFTKQSQCRHPQTHPWQPCGRGGSIDLVMSLTAHQGKEGIVPTFLMRKLRP